MSIYIRCEVEHSPAMFESEREVTVESKFGRKSFLTDRSSVFAVPGGFAVLTNLIQVLDGEVLVQVPGEFWSGGRRAWFMPTQVAEFELPDAKRFTLVQGGLSGGGK